MVNVNAAFPSKYIAAADLKNRRIVLTIDRVVVEVLGDHDRKPVIYFQGGGKGMVLNKINAQTIAMLHGEETDNWSGLQIELFTQMVNNPQGQMVPGIRCVAIPPRGALPTPNPAGAAVMSTPLATPAQSENPADGFPGDAQTTGEAIDDSLPPGF